MNKRIKKKMAKHESEQQLGVAEAYQRLEADFMTLAQALLTEGREKSAQAIEGVREKLSSSEQSLEELVAKVPGMGPQLAQMLHSATHAAENGKGASRAGGKQDSARSVGPS